MLEVADKIEIQELISRTSAAIDSHDIDQFLDGFTENGVFDRDGVVFEGREAIRAFLDEHIAAGNEEGACHLNLNVVVDERGHGARALSRVVKLALGEHAALIAVAVYTDDLTRTSSGWKFERRGLQALYFNPNV